MYFGLNIITQIILAFWLAQAYGLLKDRRKIDVIITKDSPLRFKMAESFKNSVIFNVTGRKVKWKKSCRGIEQVRMRSRKNEFNKPQGLGRQNKQMSFWPHGIGKLQAVYKKFGALG